MEAPVAAPVATAPVTPAPEVTVTVDPTPTAPMALQIAKSESLVSPNGAEYIVEGNEIKIVVRAKDGNIYKVDYATALKWKK